MNALIRVDSSTSMGTGHVMRCLTLAEDISNLGASVVFVCRPLPGNIIDLIEARGFIVKRLTEPKAYGAGAEHNYHTWLGMSGIDDAKETADTIRSLPFGVDWLVIDHYAFDSAWEHQLRRLVGRILVIDDLANRRHDCDVLLDHNLYKNMKTRYQGLVPEGCTTLIGPRFALLRREFGTARKSSRIRDGAINSILIFYGGTDPTNETAKALQALSRLVRDGTRIDAVIGLSNKNAAECQAWCSQIPNARLHRQVDNIAWMMAQADLALGAGGVSAWERCCVGLPSLITVVADNQVEIAESIDKCGAAINLGPYSTVTADTLSERLHEMMSNPQRLRALSRSAFALVDCVTPLRVSELLLRGR